LQGSQDFLWFGTISIVSGAGRLVFVWLLVATFGLGVSGAMAGVFAASLLCAAVAGWRTWSAITRPGGGYGWKDLAKRCLFLVCGVGTLSLLLSLDQLMSRRYLRPAEMDFYAVAGTIGRVVVLITVPLTNVMFPKVARSMAEDSRPAAFVHALVLVGLVGIGAALVCSVFPALPIRLLQGNKFLEAAPLVPLFAWAVLPLTLTNILVARGRFAVVPLLVLVTAGYWLFLQASHESARAIIRALFAFASLACLVSALCCWLDRRPGRRSEGAN
jgi:O-antigen/teichoic acid export membrane protein